MNRLSGVFQFILGFFVGIILLAGGTASLAYVVFYRMSINPPKPTFAEEKPQPKETAQPKQETKEAVKAKEAAPEPSPEEKEEEALPTGAYKAKVTWSTGLSLRSEPNQEAERVGGVEYDTELIVLKTSDDGNWQQVRLVGGTQEGWIKAGNIAKLEE